MMFDKVLTPEVPREAVIESVHLVLRAISHRGVARHLMVDLKDKSLQGQVASLVRQIIKEIEKKAGAKFNQIPRKKLQVYANKMAKIMMLRVQRDIESDKEAAEASLGQLRSSFDL
jgi:hypothetical protein